MSKTKSSDLALAVVSIEEGDREAGLIALLAAWRATSSPEVADVIDLLSKELSAAEEPVRAVSGTSAKKAWMALAGANRPSAFGRLLEVLPDGLDRCERLDKIIAMKRDPRITPFAREWMEIAPVQGPRRVPFFTKLIELLVRTEDVRLLPWLEQITSPEARSETIGKVGLKSWKPLVALTQTLAKTKRTKLEADAEKELARVRELLTSSSKAATRIVSADPASLFAKIYADPDDDEARAVLGDLLQQKGDPRGEFIALQLARHGTANARSAQERKLEQKWGRDWLGAIEPAVMKSDVVFERGFVTRCRYIGGAEGAKVHAAEEWSTVTHLDVSAASKYVGGSHQLLLQAPARRAMRHVVGLAREDFATLAGGAPVLWETLGMRIWRWDWTAALHAGPAETFARVRKLVIVHTEGGAIRDAPTSQIKALLDQWPAVVELEIGLPQAQVAELAAALPRQRLERLTIHSTEGITYDLDRRAQRLEIGLVTPMHADCMKTAAKTLAALATKDRFERVSTVVQGRVTREGDLLVRGPYERVSVAPLEASAKAAALPFELTLGS